MNRALRYAVVCSFSIFLAGGCSEKKPAGPPESGQTSKSGGTEKATEPTRPQDDPAEVPGVLPSIDDLKSPAEEDANPFAPAEFP